MTTAAAAGPPSGVVDALVGVVGKLAPQHCAMVVVREQGVACALAADPRLHPARRGRTVVI